MYTLFFINFVIMTQFRLCLEEERDIIQAKYLRNQSTIAELQATLHHRNNGMYVVNVENSIRNSMCFHCRLREKVVSYCHSRIFQSF